MADDQAFTLRPLTAGERTGIDHALQGAAELLQTSLPLGADSVQTLYDIALEHGHDVPELQNVVGVAFGELIAARTNMQWVRVSSEYGEETALAPEGLSLSVNPVSMMAKRLQQAAPVDIAALLAEVADALEQLRSEGAVDAR